jgi:hypothetical protein
MDLRSEEMTQTVNERNECQVVLREILGKLLQNPQSKPTNKAYWREVTTRLACCFADGNAKDLMTIQSWSEVARLISLSYARLSQLPNRNKTRGIQRVTVKPFVADWGKTTLFRSLVKLWSDLEKYCSGFYLHGSLADGRITEYSDCDTLIVIRNEVARSWESLCELRQILLSTGGMLRLHDPYQHHGHFVLTEMDLESYPETFLPVAALSRSVVLGGNSILSICPRSAEKEAIALLESMANQIGSKARMVDQMSVKDYKNFLSYVMLTPALVLGAEGKFVFKGDSFDIARARYTDEEWSVIEWATQQRADWKLDCFYSKIVRRICCLFPARALWILRYFDFLVSKARFFDRANRLPGYLTWDNCLRVKIDQFIKKSMVAQSGALRSTSEKQGAG